MGSRRKLLIAALSASFVWFLLLVSLPIQSNRNATITISSARSVKLIGNKERPLLHQNFNLNSVSRRRVPNGPDPIHNRRAGRYKLPQT